MDFSYEVVRIWERSWQELLTSDLGVAPLAMLGRLPEDLSLEEGLAVVAKSLAERLAQEAPPDRAKKLLTDAFLLTGLRVRRDVASRIFRGVHAMEDSDTFLAIIDEGQEKALREAILALGEDRFGAPGESMKASLSTIADLDRLKRVLRRTPKAGSWKDLLDTP